MIAAVIAGLALASSPTGQAHSATLDSVGACRLAGQPVEQTEYSIAGKWFADIHTSILELPQCDTIILLEIELDSPAARKIAMLHQSMYQICGVFSGHFERGQSGGLEPPQPAEIFVVRDVELANEHLNSSACSG